MYKNLIGLERLNGNFKKPNAKKVDNKSSGHSEHNSQLNESKSEQSFNDLYIENEIETESAEDFYASNFSNDPNFLAENEDDNDENEYCDLDKLNQIEDSEDKKSNRLMRLDLMNEIKDEIFDEKLDSQSIAEVDKEDEEDNEDDEEQNDYDTVNLNTLKVCIDEIEELTDKSNKQCYVFVIQVWNISETNSDLSPNWQVKRKYDEFYVLDTKLKEFHGDGLNTEIEQIPSKQRALFFISNSRNIEYLNSVKTDFAKYIQVKFVKV